MFWLLVDVKRCRVVADLASIVRQRFMDGVGSGLNLYVEDCLLPPGESILVIRDNDSIRVKWEKPSTESNCEPTNCEDKPKKKSKKRHRQKCEAEEVVKPKKQKTVSSPSDPNPANHFDRKKRKKKKRSSSSSDHKSLASPKESPLREEEQLQDGNLHSSPDSSDSDTLVIKKPKVSSLPSALDSPLTTAGGEVEGSETIGPKPIEYGRGRNTDFFYTYDGEAEKRRQLQESATNISIIVQNTEDTVQKDYTSLPLLAAPPQVGKVIAFKLLEISESYTPEVSDYKEGTIMSFDPFTQQIEMEIISKQTAKQPGKFDLVYQSEDGSDVVEFAVPQETKMTLSWSSLIEPRLLLDPETPTKP
ncbi:hypothetical protein GDO86_016740 [Hymenochirus boettgeri]|uniref:Coilin n=1 Tax=Hymenochirus boettgeri TaxID=247094 RepID=A0A8T2IKP2_9PIPI|nr:hypothetical protein GDO86_016740 [Hymenochirus boettgeri]